MEVCPNIHGVERLTPADFGNPLAFPLVPPVGQSLNLTSEIFHISTFTRRIGTRFYIDIHGAKLMYPKDFDDPLTSPLPPSVGSHLRF